jgi:hypothetical protein
MEYTVNQQNIQKYAERLTNELCRQFFVNKAFISGPEILSFNSENQLNLLIIKNIYLNWQKETLKLKSQYFDYEEEDVKQALKTFMNKLSNHIKVYRYDFEPLVSKSIADFILLAAAPQDFFTKESEALASPKIQLSLFKEFGKYIKVNRFVIDQVVRDIEVSGYTETFGGETIRFIIKALNENPDKVESPEVALKGLQEQLPFEVTDFVSIPKPLVTRPSFLDQPKPEVEKEPEFIPVSRPAFLDETPVVEKPVEATPVVTFEPEEPALPEQITEVEEPETISDFQTNTYSEPVEEVVVNEEPPQPDYQPSNASHSQKEVAEMAKEPITLNDTLRNSEQRTLVDALQVKTSTVPFKTLIPLHYRFTFINSLFAGNQQAWAEAVEKIDAADSYEEAIAMLRSTFAGTFNWDKEEDNVAILFTYVERKF